jgi:hypothetical protein
MRHLRWKTNLPMRAAVRFVIALISMLSLALSPSAWAATPLAESHKNHASLCSVDETVVFACAVKGQRLVSVCASRALSSSSGYVQYRFGRPAKIEVAVPTTATSATSATSAAADAAAWRSDVRSHTVMYAGGGGAYLRFNQGRFSYVTYAAMGRGWVDKQGVMVLKSGKIAAVHKCVGTLTSQLGGAFFRHSGIVEDAEELELPSGDLRPTGSARK